MILVCWVVALFVDPLFFFLPALSEDECIKIQKPLETVLMVLRTITDSFYLFHMALQFRIAYTAPSSQMFGRGILVYDPKLLARRYLKKDFWLDLIAVLPIPQVVIWIFAKTSEGPTAYHTKNALGFIVLQYIPRVYLIFPLISQVIKSTGFVMETAWAGAANYLVFYILASQFIGACWYFLAIERKDTCWREQCKLEKNICNLDYLYCGAAKDGKQREIWHTSTNVFSNCDTSGSFFDFGIYQDVFDKHIVTAKYMNKYLFCLWFGLRQLSSLGQNLSTSTSNGEIIFAIFIAIFGLLLFTLLIGNMQTYLQSWGARLEEWKEWRGKQGETEKWMQQRQLPQRLRDRVRRYNQYKWIATRGVEEEGLLHSLPPDLRRDIKRHLCLDLVLQVPLFRELDDRLLDAICERLKPVLRTKDTEILIEGGPVNEMLFIIRGILVSQTTRANFFGEERLGPGCFCGDELLTYVLNSNPSIKIPTSTRTVMAQGEVEAFALAAEDLKFLSIEFQLARNKKLGDTFRYYSQQWRTWAACFIQATWR